MLKYPIFDAYYYDLSITFRKNRFPAVIQVFNDVSTTVKTIETYFLIKKKNISEKERPKLKS